MDEIGKALTELVKQGSPIAGTAVYYWYITQWIGAASAIGVTAIIMGGLFSIAKVICACITGFDVRNHERYSR